MKKACFGKKSRPPPPILTKRGFSSVFPDELWVADITYIPTFKGWLYLAVIACACTRRCCGWSMRKDLSADLVVDALSMAVLRRRPREGTIHHSDRGSQYRSLSFGKTLRDSGIIPSMGRSGDPFESAAAESFPPSLKTELIHRSRFRTRDEARTNVFSYIEGFYNPVRRHSALGYKSPAEYERMLEEERLKDPILSR